MSCQRQSRKHKKSPFSKNFPLMVILLFKSSKVQADYTLAINMDLEIDLQSKI